MIQQLQTLHTIGPDVHHNDYHIQIIRSQLTRNLSALFPDIRDEISTAFSELIPPSQGTFLAGSLLTKEILIQ